MYLFHHGFRRDLDSFAAAIDATPLDDRVAWQALSRRWALFAVLLHDHQQGEDLGVWPRLRQRADAEQREVLWALEAEHDEIDPLLRECRQGFLRLAETPDPELAGDLRLGLLAARGRTRAHLDHEECVAMPIVQRLLDEADWERIQQDHFRTGVRLKRVVHLTGWGLHGVPADVRAAVL